MEQNDANENENRNNFAENAEAIINEVVEFAGMDGGLDHRIENDLNNLVAMNQVQIHIPIEDQAGDGEAPPTGDSVIIIERDEHNSLHDFASSIKEAATLFSTYNKTLRLIESTASDIFNNTETQNWTKLVECVQHIAEHPRVTPKMKMRCFLINKDNVKTFNMLQEHFKLDLDNLYFMGKMNLLHISCDTGWSNLARELILEHGMNVNQPCPSLHMRPASLTPLMLAVGAGHEMVVRVLLEHPDTKLEMKDSYGMTAVFHCCNHGHHRVGDAHGYFRRLWSWDLSQEQLDEMEQLARDNAIKILKMLIGHGSNIFERDNTGALLLTRAASVDKFRSVIEFLVSAGARVTENVMNWVKVRNPDCAPLCESMMKKPNSLMCQSRAAIWKHLIHVSNTNTDLSYKQRLQTLVEEEELPIIIVDYLMCKS